MKRFCLVSIQSIVWIVNYFVQCESQHPGILGWKLWKVLQSWTEYVVFKIHVSVLFLLSWEVSLELETLLWKNKHRVSNTHPGCPELLESEGFPQISLNLKIFLEFPWFWKKTPWISLILANFRFSRAKKVREWPFLLYVRAKKVYP